LGYDSSNDAVAVLQSTYLTQVYQHATVMGIILTAYKDKVAHISRELTGLVMEGKFITH
jgi:NADPH-dependent curcumin reductase CurA